jgi:hypothetical protein
MSDRGQQPTYFEQALASLRTAETHISTEFQDDLDIILATTTKTDPRFAFMPEPGRIELETDAAGVREFYESSRAVFQPARLRVRHQLTTDWYYLLEGVASRYGRSDGEEYTVNTVTLFPKADDGILGEFLWERYDVPDPTEDESQFDPSMAPGARTDLPLRAVRALRIHDRLVQALRANDVDALVADFREDFLLGARSYVPDYGPMVASEGREAATAYWRAFFDRYRIEELSVMNRLTADWYVFAEHAITCTLRSQPDFAAQQFRTAAVYPIVGGGRVQGELGYGTDAAPASTREKGSRGIAFIGRDDHAERLP